MEFIIFYGVMVLVLPAQVLLTVFAKRRWLKWLPAMILGLLTVLCGIAYAMSGGTNWGFLILIAGLVMLLAGAAVAAVFGLLLCRLIRKK